MKGDSKKLSAVIRNTTIDGIQVRINRIEPADGSCSMYGYLIDENGIRLDADIQGTITARNQDEVDIKISNLMARLMEKYENWEKGQQQPRNLDHPYTIAWDELGETAQLALLPNTWRSEKHKCNALADFRTLLEFLDDYGEDINEDDLEEVVQRRFKKANEHGNSSADPETLNATVRGSVKAFNAIYPVFRAMVPEACLPEIHLPVPLAAHGALREQVKYLPDEVLAKLADILFTMINTNSLALGAIMMLVAMCRTAEACAIQFKHILDFGRYAVFAVLQQSDGTYVAVDDLKTNSAYRLAIIPKFGRDAVIERKNWLLKQGYTEEEIREMPVVSAPNDLKKMAEPKDLSKFVRFLLELCGMDDSYWRAVNQTMLAEPDHDGHGKRPDDCSAYVLRRNGCTQYVNRAGMDWRLVDALMGHAVDDPDMDWAEYVRNPDNWAVIAAQTERWVLDPEHSAHPGFDPVELGIGARTEVEEQTEIVFITKEDGEYCFSALAAEADDDIEVRMPASGAEITTPMLTVSQEYAPIIGVVHDEKWFMRMRRKGNAYDLGEYAQNTLGKNETAEAELAG